MRRSSTASSANGSEESTGRNEVLNSCAGVLAANGPAVSGPMGNGPVAADPPWIEATDSASNCARGSSDPAAARELGFKIGSAIR